MEAIKLQYEEAWKLHPIEWVITCQTGAVTMSLLFGGVFWYQIVFCNGIKSFGFEWSLACGTMV
eukprot:4467127-Ditylum_brightwellii.AAC.1